MSESKITDEDLADPEAAEAHRQAVPDRPLAATFAVTLGPLTVAALEGLDVRRPLLDRDSAVVVEIGWGGYASSVTSRALLQPQERERMALALAPWLCPTYQDWQNNAKEGQAPPAGHGTVGACRQKHCRAVTTKGMAALEVARAAARAATELADRAREDA